MRRSILLLAAGLVACGVSGAAADSADDGVADLRGDLAAERYFRCSDLKRMRDGGRVAVAGLVLIRQKPGSAKGVMFITLEDETGIANLIVWPSLLERQRALVPRAGCSATGGVYSARAKSYT